MRKLIKIEGISWRLPLVIGMLYFVLSILLMTSCAIIGQTKPVEVMPEARITPLKRGEVAPYDCVAITTSAYAKLIEKAKGNCQ